MPADQAYMLALRIAAGAGGWFGGKKVAQHVSDEVRDAAKKESVTPVNEGIPKFAGAAGGAYLGATMGADALIPMLASAGIPMGAAAQLATKIAAGYGGWHLGKKVGGAVEDEFEDTSAGTVVDQALSLIHI